MINQEFFDEAVSYFKRTGEIPTQNMFFPAPRCCCPVGAVVRNRFKKYVGYCEATSDGVMAKLLGLSKFFVAGVARGFDNQPYLNGVIENLEEDQFEELDNYKNGYETGEALRKELIK